MVLGVVKKRKQLTHDLRITRVEREEMRATMEAQTVRIQELEARILEERQRANTSHTQFQTTDGRLIRIVEEVRNCVDGIMAECATMADRIEEAMGGGGPGDVASSDEVEMDPWRMILLRMWGLLVQSTYTSDLLIF